MIATLLSLLVSFTVVPWLYSRFGKLEHISSKSFFGRVLNSFERGLEKITTGIGNMLKWALRSRRNKIATIVGTIVLFIASIMLLGKGYIGTDFFPTNDKGEFYLQIEMNKDGSIEQTNFTTQQAENYLTQKPEISREARDKPCDYNGWSGI